MNNYPLISIVTPVYNCEEYIRDCIESVLAQNYPNFEHIIVDGNSNDRTVDIIKEYEHIKWISEPDDGEADALNKALRMAQGEVIGWLNGDDYYCEGAFQRIIAEIYPRTQHHIVHGNCRFINDAGELISIHTPTDKLTLPLLLRFWESGLFPRQPSVFYTKEVFEKIGLFRTDLHFAVDYDHWLRCVLEYDFFYIDQILSVARLRINCKSAENIPAQYQALIEVSKPYHDRISREERLQFLRGYYFKYKPFVTFQPLRQKLALGTKYRALRDKIVKR